MDNSIGKDRVTAEYIYQVPGIHKFVKYHFAI